MTKRPGNWNRGPAHNRYVHGMSGTPTYKSWQEMKARCYGKYRRDYKHWGGRGIRVCEEWHDFRNFLSDMGVKPEGLTLERLDNDGNYEPSNCVWASRLEQVRNRSVNKLTMKLAESMRADRESGFTLEQLAEKYDTSLSNAHRVVTHQIWRA